MTWKNREIDWYNAERRFIFSTPTKKENDEWQAAINLDTVKTKIKENLKSMFGGFNQKKVISANNKPIYSNRLSLDKFKDGFENKKSSLVSVPKIL